VRVDNDMKKKDLYKKVVEAIEDNLSHPRKYQDFKASKAKPKEDKYADLDLDKDDIIL